MKKKIKSKLSKKYVTDGELLKDMRDQLITELPKLTRRNAFWTLFPYLVILGFASLFFVDFRRPIRPGPDLRTIAGAEITIVKMPQPNWDEYGLQPAPDYWHIPNPAGRSAHVFDIALTTQAMTYKRTVVRALAQDLAGEARLDLLEPPLVVKCPTVLFITPANMDPKDLPVREAVIRTCALQLANKQVPLHTFVDPYTHHGKLIIELATDRGRNRLDENLNLAFTRVVHFVTPILDR